MTKNQGLTTNMMTNRILERNDNIYKKEIIYNVLVMYADEIQKSILKGERVGITGVGTIIPELKTRECYSLPCCNNAEGNPPYTKIRMSRTNTLHDKMNETLLKNIENGIYGLENLTFSKQQMTYLKNGGFIPEDAEFEDEED